MKFSRSTRVPKYNQYRKYFPILRRDFLNRCAYCTIKERENGGKENFEIDHFKPKILFRESINDYSNLYYSCHACNQRKGSSWPSPELEKNNYGFIDPCIEDPYEIHLNETDNGMLLPLTNKGKYSIDHIRLNRKSLIELRQFRRKINEIIPEMKKSINQIVIKESDEKESEALQQLSNFIKQIESEICS